MTRVLVTVGTDTHPFDRLRGWVDRAARRHGNAVDWFVQHGYTAPPAHARGEAFLDHDEMEKLLVGSDVLICHGGPGTILEARRTGRRPIVVPRLRRLGEHVDDHQHLFVRRLVVENLVWSAETVEEFDAVLDQVLADPASALLDTADRSGNEASVQRFGELVSGLFVERRDPRRNP